MITNACIEGDDIIVNSVQDVEPVIEQCKTLSNNGFNGSSDMKYAASFPMVVVEEYCKRVGITFQEWTRNKDHIKRMLNDPSLSAFRVWPGKV